MDYARYETTPMLSSAKDTFQQGDVVVNGCIDHDEFEERTARQQTKDFNALYMVPYPHGVPMPGSDPNNAHHYLKNEIAFRRVGAPPSEQQEPVFVTSLTGALVARDELRPDELKHVTDENALAYYAMRRLFLPIGINQHDVRVTTNTRELPDRPNVRTRGLFNFFCTESVNYGDLLEADVPRPGENRATIEHGGEKAVGVWRRFDPRNIMPTPEHYAAVFNLHSAEAAGSVKEVSRHEDPEHFSHALARAFQLAFFLGAHAYKNAQAAGADDPEVIAGLKPLPTDIAARAPYLITNSFPATAQYGEWGNKGVSIPQMLMRVMLGLQPAMVSGNPEWKKLPANVRTLMMSAGPDLVASLNENLVRTSQRVIAVSTRAQQPGFQGEALLRVGI